MVLFNPLIGDKRVQYLFQGNKSDSERNNKLEFKHTTMLQSSTIATALQGSFLPSKGKKIAS